MPRAGAFRLSSVLLLFTLCILAECDSATTSSRRRSSRRRARPGSGDSHLVKRVTAMEKWMTKMSDELGSLKKLVEEHHNNGTEPGTPEARACVGKLVDDKCRYYSGDDVLSGECVATGDSGDGGLWCQKGGGFDESLPVAKECEDKAADDTCTYLVGDIIKRGKCVHVLGAGGGGLMCRCQGGMCRDQGWTDAKETACISDDLSYKKHQESCSWPDRFNKFGKQVGFCLCYTRSMQERCYCNHGGSHFRACSAKKEGDACKHEPSAYEKLFPKKYSGKCVAHDDSKEVLYCKKAVSADPDRRRRRRSTGA